MKLAIALLALSAAAHASIAPLPEAPKPQPKHDYIGLVIACKRNHTAHAGCLQHRTCPQMHMQRGGELA